MLDPRDDASEYSAQSDPYCYPGTDILLNKAGIKNHAALKEFETAMSFARADEPLPEGDFSVRHYRAVHHHLFQDVYAWAGEFRTVRITKDASVFCYPENIAHQMGTLFEALREGNFFIGRTRHEFAAGSAHFLGELNSIHPFREGNGRTQNIFLTLIARHAGFFLDVEHLEPHNFLNAMIQSFGGNEQPLVEIIERLVHDDTL